MILVILGSNEPQWIRYCPKGSSMKSRNLTWGKWPYLAHFLTDSCHFGLKWTPKVTTLSQTVPKGITQPPNGEMAVSSTFLNRFSSFLVQMNTKGHHIVPNGITQPPNGKMAVSSPFLARFLSFWVQMNTKGHHIVPNSPQWNHTASQW